MPDIKHLLFFKDSRYMSCHSNSAAGFIIMLLAIILLLSVIFLCSGRHVYFVIISLHVILLCCVFYHKCAYHLTNVFLNARSLFIFHREGLIISSTVYVMEDSQTCGRERQEPTYHNINNHQMTCARMYYIMFYYIPY